MHIFSNRRITFAFVAFAAMLAVFMIGLAFGHWPNFEHLPVLGALPFILGDTSAAPATAQQLIQRNAAMRMALLSTAPKMSKRIGAFNGFTLGQTARIKLQNVGILQQLRVRVTAPITIGVNPATPSLKAPYNLLNRIRVTDYDGVDHANVSAHQLFVVNSYRNQAPFDRNNEGMPAVIAQPQTPTAVAPGTLDFWIVVPISYDPANDLRGAMLMQSAVGDSFLVIDINPTLIAVGNGDAVYQGAAGTTVVQTGGAAPGIQFEVFQDYLLPQALDKAGNIPIPAMDLRTVYELSGMITDNTNLALNQQKLLQYPNLRSVIGAYFSYVTNQQLAALGSLANIQLIANANNVVWDENEQSQLFRQRRYLNGDLLPGVFAFMHRDLPIQTALFGNVQASFVPAIAPVAPAYIEYTYESFYSKGMALPGVNQG